MLRTQFLAHSLQAVGNVNPFSTNVPFIRKQGSWFLLEKCDLIFYLKCHPYTGAFHISCN